MSAAYKQLLKSQNDREQMIGAYIHGLIDRASASEQGLSARQKLKEGNLFFQDSAVLGEFRISMADPQVEHLFVSRANR
jgi:hypothetical protein